LQDVIDAAVDDGVIFCSAAGNVIGNQDWFPIVVWPAAMDKVIAVGGGNCKGEAWDGSSRGPEVNISAEAQDVWHADGLKGATQPGGPVGTTASPGQWHLFRHAGYRGPCRLLAGASRHFQLRSQIWQSSLYPAGLCLSAADGGPYNPAQLENQTTRTGDHRWSKAAQGQSAGQIAADQMAGG
jgi:hypothetical protein